MDWISRMSAKLPPEDLIKIKVFSYKGYTS